jgi:hypothetical protein
MEESLLLSQDKTFLKTMALSRGLTSSGFNGRTLSRMRKKDFIDFILLNNNNLERLEDFDPSLEEEVTAFIFEALPSFFHLNLHSSSSSSKKEELKEIRSPNEEDEPITTLNLEEVKDKNVFKIIKELEIKITCVVCQSNMRNVVFIPCNHLATCIACSKSPLLKACPLCRSAYTAKNRIFF